MPWHSQVQRFVIVCCRLHATGKRALAESPVVSLDFTPDCHLHSRRSGSPVRDICKLAPHMKYGHTQSSDVCLKAYLPVNHSPLMAVGSE